MGQYAPQPAFDYAYSWGLQQGDTALVDDPAFQGVFAAHDAGAHSTSRPPTEPDVGHPAFGRLFAAPGSQRRCWEQARRRRT